MARYDRHANLPAAALQTLVRRVVDDGVLGVAVIAGAQHLHVAANNKYERLVGAPAVGRTLGDVLAPAVISDVFLAGVREGGPAALREVERNGTFVTFSFCRVDGSPSVLVIAEDATAVVHERERAKLFMALTAELVAAVEPRRAVRSVVTRAQRELGARSSSVFVLDEEGRTLRGHADEWDWTRTSFTVQLGDWPNVAQTLASGRARFITKTGAAGAEVGWFEARGIVATLCVPLRANDSSIGVLFFDFDSERRLPIASLDFADAIGAQCAAALARASRPVERVAHAAGGHDAIRRLHRARAAPHTRGVGRARAHGGRRGLQR